MMSPTISAIARIPIYIRRVRTGSLLSFPPAALQGYFANHTDTGLHCIMPEYLQMTHSPVYGWIAFG